MRNVTKAILKLVELVDRGKSVKVRYGIWRRTYIEIDRTDDKIDKFDTYETTGILPMGGISLFHTSCSFVDGRYQSFGDISYVTPGSYHENRLMRVMKYYSEIYERIRAANTSGVISCATLEGMAKKALVYAELDDDIDTIVSTIKV